jgi:hypothetical protein
MSWAPASGVLAPLASGLSTAGTSLLVLAIGAGSVTGLVMVLLVGAVV